MESRLHHLAVSEDPEIVVQGRALATILGEPATRLYRDVVDAAVEARRSAWWDQVEPSEAQRAQHERDTERLRTALALLDGAETEARASG